MTGATAIGERAHAILVAKSPLSVCSAMASATRRVSADAVFHRVFALPWRARRAPHLDQERNRMKMTVMIM
jgi:hypothetical protein